MRKLLLTYGLFLLVLFPYGNLQAQDDAVEPNPFDLLFRLDEEKKLAIIQPQGNPFDISLPAESLKKKLKEAEKYNEDGFIVQISRFEDDKPVPKIWLLYLLIPLILLTTLVVSLFRPQLELLYKSITNSNVQNLAYRESIGRANVHSFLLYLIAIISVAVFALVLMNESHVNTENFIKACVAALTLSAVYMLTKYFAIYFVKIVFPDKKTMDFYLFAFGQYNHILGLLLIPFSVFLAFAPTAAAPFISYAAIGAVGIWWLGRIFRGLQIGSKFMSVNVFRFFAYLCTVEIAPVLILLTTLKLMLGF